MSHPLHLILLAVLPVSVLIAGCGKSEERKAATQVVAKVNGYEISIHQVNAALGRIANVGEAQAKQASRTVLDQLIDQQLLIQKAEADKLDRDSAIVAAIEASRRQILARATLERGVAALAKPTSDEVKKYYNEHPELFSKRRIYRFQEIIANVPADKADAVSDQAAKVKNLNEMAAWLGANKIQFNANFELKAAEQLPMEILPRLQKMRPGETMHVREPGRSMVVQLVASQEVPLSEKDATPFIEQFLFNRKRNEFAVAELKRLRSDAKVEYQGEFASLASESKAAVQVPAASTAPASSSSTGSSDGVSRKSKDAKSEPSLVDKGLSGLR